MDDFIKSPTVQAFEAFKKPELLTLAQKLGLIHVKVSMRKPAIRREIAEYYYDERMFTDDDLARFPPFVSENVSELDLAKLKLEHEIKMKQLELERQKEEQLSEEREKQRVLEEKKLELELESRRLQEQKKLELELEDIEKNSDSLNWTN